ncbi:MAG: hypothetical protein KKA84_06940 [Bacteroidetes bacterium]|nr:hypothetical protein [Bacteroidota bacterium]
MITSSQKYLIIKGFAGLGNRILALLTGILYAELTNRKIVVDWRDKSYSDSNENSFYKFFDSEFSPPIEDIDDSDSIYPERWKNNLECNLSEFATKTNLKQYMLPKNWSKSTIDPAKIIYAENVIVFWAFTQLVFKFRRYFKSFKMEYYNRSTKSILSEVYKKHLPLVDDLRLIVEEFCHQTLMENNIGIHIRYTDKKSNLKPMLKKLEHVVKENPSSKIFLATDNPKIIEMLNEKYSNIITFPKWFPKENVPLHGLRNNSPGRIQHGYETIIEIYALAKCKVLILDTDSSFDYIVGLLTNHNTIIHDFRKLKWMPEYAHHILWKIYYSTKYRA